MPGWYLDMMIALQRPYERLWTWRTRRYITKRGRR